METKISLVAAKQLKDFQDFGSGTHEGHPQAPLREAMSGEATL